MNENKNYPIGKTIHRLLDNVTKENKKLYLGFAIYTLLAATYPFFAVLLPKFILDELAKGTQASIMMLLMIVGAYFVGTGTFGFGKTYIHDLCFAKLTALRIHYIAEMFEKIVSLEYRHMEDAKFFETNGRALEATGGNENGVEGVYHKLFSTPAVLLTALVYAVLIGILNPLILLGLVLNAAVIIFVGNRLQRYEYAKKEEVAHWNRRKQYYYNTTYDFAYGKDIRLYGLKARVLDNYNKEIRGYIGVQKMIANREYALSFLTLLSLLISDGLTYGVLIYKAAHGMSIADFSMYLGMVIGLSILIKMVSDNVNYVWREGQYVNDFYAFLDANFSEQYGNHPAIKGDTLEIEFKDVSFKYPGTDNYIFKNLNFTIHKGERLAIVGINGAGKSTIVKLMTGLFKVKEGQILINGIDIGEFDQKALYEMFSVVFQDVNVLAFTIEENVACSSENVDEKRVDAALEKVGLLEKVKGFEKGTKQMMLKIIDEDGTDFSGGEKQKLAIARALYEDGNMIIMDEPTAALDALAEAEIYQNFSSLIKGKTAVYISHRLASTKFCDKIALFGKEGLLEYGNHEEMMALGGHYYNMFTVQGKYYQEGGNGDEENC